MGISPVVIQDSARSLLLQWANEHDSWAKLIVSEVLNSPTALSEDFLKVVYQHFLIEKQLAPGDRLVISALEDPGGGADTADSLYLRKLHRLKNVNALAAGQEIEFNRRLTIVFGENASGKTGYVRVIKQVAAARSIEKVLPDVVKVQGNTAAPSAEVVFTLGDEQRSLVWKNETGLPPFTRIDVFDSRATNIHVDDDLKYVYTPSELARFPRVQKGVDFVKTSLESAIRDASKAPNQFGAYFTSRQTKVFSLIEALGASTDMAAVESLSQVSEAEQQRIGILKADVDTLKSSNPDLQIKALTDIKNHVEALGKAVAVIADFNADSYETLLEKRAAARKGLEEASKTSFAGLPIPRLLEEEWKRFIVAGEEYLRTLPGSESYPHTSENCLYCHQPLSQSAVDLIRKYREYCNNTYRDELENNQKALAALTGTVGALDFGRLNGSLAVVLDANKADEEASQRLEGVVENGQAMASALVEGREFSWPDRTAEAGHSKSWLKTLWEQCQAGLKDLSARKDERDRLLREKEFEVAELEARLKLSQILPLVKEFVDRAKWIDRAKIQLGKFQGILRSLTEKSKLASTVVLNRDFEKLFQEECRALRVPAMALQFPGRDAQAVRKKIVAGDHKPSAILSEGEQKVTALADFLAEVALKPPAPVVFDDPINSLDYIRINEVVDRIAVLSASRQVIVFTHNIWFATALLAKFEKQVQECSYYDVTRDTDTVGLVAKSTNPRADSVKSLTASINGCFDRASKETGEFKQIWIEKAYEYLRSLCEVIVEQELLAGATRRFEPNVRMTVLKNIKGQHLASAFAIIVPVFEDCCRFMSSHSQPLETLNVRPTLERAKQDFKKVQDARDAYIKAAS